MLDVLDYEVELSSDGKPVHLVVFFIGPDMLTESQVTESLQNRLTKYILPDHLTFLVPLCFAPSIKKLCKDPASPLALALERISPDSLCSYGFSFYDETGVITKYTNISGNSGKIGQLITSSSEEIIEAGLKRLVKNTSVLTKAPAGFMFSKPSTRASNYFIRAENLLSETLHAHFLAFACLKLFKLASSDKRAEPDTIYLDTMAFLPVALSILLYRSRFGNNRPLEVRSFHSHDGLKDGPLPNVGTAICIISASTQCGLAKEWTRLNRVSPTRVTTVLSFAGKSEYCTILHKIEQPEDFEMQGDQEPTGSRRLIRLHGERFVAEHSETRFLNIGTEHSPSELQAKFHAFMGAGLFNCFTRENLNSRARTVHVDKTKLVTSKCFEKWFATCLDEEVAASTSRIIYDDDGASKALAEKTISFLKSKGIQSCVEVGFNAFIMAHETFDGSVIVIAAAAERGARLLSVSRRLRTAQLSGTRLYIVGALFGRSYEHMNELCANLTQPPKGHRRYVVKKYLEIPAASALCSSHWEQEQRLLRSLFAIEAVVSTQVRERMELLDKAAHSGPSEEPFWPSSHTGQQMKLSKGFAFVDGSHDVRIASAADIYLTILWILQNAREGAKIRDAKRLESGELHQVLLSPEVFSRFDDGVIQASFLRAALPTELDYRAHETYSIAMADIIMRVAMGYGQERGESAMEFVIAIAIRKIQLHKEVDEQLRAWLAKALNGHIPEVELLLNKDSPSPI